MRFTFEFGKRGKHSVEAQNRRLRQEKEALCALLEQERRAHQETARQLVDALTNRIEKRRQLPRSLGMGQGLAVLPGGQPRPVVRVHPEVREARFQLVDGGGELVVGGGRTR